MINIKLNYSNRKIVMDFIFDSKLAAVTFKNVAKLVGLKVDWEKENDNKKTMNKVCLSFSKGSIKDYKDPYMKSHLKVK